MTITNKAYKTTLNNLSELKDYVGKEIGLSEWMEVTQANVNTFADVTEDRQWIHVDPQRSQQYSPYKTTIAHGFYVLSLASKIAYETFMVEDIAMGVNYGLNKVRFINATPVGAKVRGRIVLKEYKEIPNGARYIMELTFELEGQEKPACVAEWIGQAYTYPNEAAQKAAKAMNATFETPTSNGAEKEATVLWSTEGKVGIIKLNRPSNYNAINDDLLRDFSAALDKAKMDDNVRAVVVHGSGKGFCAGADLSGGGSLGRTPRQVRDMLNTNYGDVIRRLTEMNKPVIAAIHGSAAGAGIGFALACDFRVMAENANMRYAFINIGLAPDAGSSWFLARTVGYSKALEIATEGEKIPASECLRLNLTNKVAPQEELLQTTMDWAKRLAERPTLGFALTKKDLKFAMTHSLPESIAYEAENQVIGLSSEDFIEGGTAFMEKRKPVFKGK